MAYECVFERAGIIRCQSIVQQFQFAQAFALQARVTTLVTGLSGFYMLQFLHAWPRYADPHYAWIHLMTVVWAIFTLVLFVLEPLFLHRWFHELARRDDVRAFRLVQRLHIVLLTISLVAVAGGVAGAHGWL